MMKKLIGLLLGLIVMPLYADDTVKELPYQLKVQNIETNRGGQLIVLVFMADGFPIEHARAIRQKRYPVQGADMDVTILVPADVPFALKVLHDEDLNAKVTKNWTGIIPAEGLGFSNGARIRFGPPDFADARVSYSEKPQLIKMRY